MKYDRIIKKIERFKIAEASGGGRGETPMPLTSPDCSEPQS